MLLSFGKADAVGCVPWNAARERGEEGDRFGGVRGFFEQRGGGVEVGVGVAGGLGEGVQQRDRAFEIVGAEASFGEGEVVGGGESVRGE